MPAAPFPLSRRALVTGGLAGAALALAGCDAIGDVLDGDDGPGVSGAVTPTAPPADADSDLVASVLTALEAAGALATAVGTTVPGLAALATPFARLHDAHLAELGGSGSASGSASGAAPVVPGGKGAALRRLAQSEARLQDRLVQAAGRAESGALAQVLAAMAAAVAQQRTVLG